MSAIPLRRIEGKYEILEKLGEGGMGAVYKVRHRLLDELRVVKMMRPQLVADEEFKARFQREARVAIKLRHPNIAQLYDFTIDDEDGTASIVMEYIQGMTLEEILRNSGPPPLGLALEVAQQSLRAIGALHGKGFVHRDISPDNLMLTEDADGFPLVKLIDLGIAKVLDAGAEGSNLTGTGIFLGKVRYAPPEQFGTEGAAMVDARGDLYSFGVVLYELLTGKYPIQGRDPSSLIAGHLFRAPVDFAETDPVGRVPPALRASVLKALAKTPDERFASAQEMGEALAALRVAGDVSPAELRRVLTRLPIGTVRTSLPPPGSTQDRLDLQFGLRTTPSRGTAPDKTQAPTSQRRSIENTVAMIERQLKSGDLLSAETELQWAVDTFGEQAEFRELRQRLQQRRSREVELRVQTFLREAESLHGSGGFEAALERLEKARVLAPGNPKVLALLEKTEAALRQEADKRRARDVEGVVEQIEAALSRSDYRAAEMLLYQAEASHGEQEAFTRLYQRMVDLQRRALEERRRAERLAAAVAGIEERLAQGELDGAESRLSEAVSTFGEEPALAGLRARLEDLRRAERQSRAAALAESAVRRRDEGNLEGALEDARRALELDPDQAAAGALEAGIAAELARRAEEERRQQEAAAHLASARSRREAGDLENALAEARQALALNPDHADAWALAEEAEAELHRREEEARQAARLAASATAVETLLHEGDLDTAGALLAEAVSSHGEAEVLRGLRSRLLELRHEQEIAALVEGARSRQAAGDLEGALGEARHVLTLDAENAPAQTLVREIEAEQKRREDEARRAAELAAALDSIRVRLEEGDLARAGDLLDETASFHGEVEALKDLRSRLEERRRQEREAAEIVASLAKARELRKADDLLGALEAVSRVFDLDAENAPARALVQEIEAERKRREDEARRAEQLAASLASIDACLDQADPEGAARLLPGAVAAFGDVPLLRERWGRIEALRRRRVEERVSSLVAQGRERLAAGELETALRAVREAGQILPEYPDAAALAAEIGAEQRRRDEEVRRERELADALASIDASLEKGDLAGAARLLPGAVARFGGAPALRERWERLDGLQKKARVESLRAEAEALARDGHRDRAARKLRQALEIDPGHREIADLLDGLTRG